MRALVLLGAVVELACGQSALTAVLSGPVNGTFAVTRLGFSAAGATYTEFDILTVSSDPGFAFVITFAGVSLPTGAFSDSSANFIGCSSEVDAPLSSGEDDPASWGQFSQPAADTQPGGVTQSGTFSLHLSSVGASSANPGLAGGTQWVNAHGMLTSTLLPMRGNPSTDNVTVSAVF